MLFCNTDVGGLQIWWKADKLDLKFGFQLLIQKTLPIGDINSLGHSGGLGVSRVSSGLRNPEFNSYIRTFAIHTFFQRTWQPSNLKLVQCQEIFLEIV